MAFHCPWKVHTRSRGRQGLLWCGHGYPSNLPSIPPCATPSTLPNALQTPCGTWNWPRVFKPWDLRPLSLLPPSIQFLGFPKLFLSRLSQSITPLMKLYLTINKGKVALPLSHPHWISWHLHVFSSHLCPELLQGRVCHALFHPVSLAPNAMDIK